MVCSLSGLLRADLAITNGDFEDQSAGAVNVVDWYDLDTRPEGGTNDWWNTTSNTQGPEPFPTNSGFLGDNWPSAGEPDGGGRWMYQQIGTKEANTGYTISFEYAQPTDGNANRSVGIQVDIYQGSFAGAAEDVDIDGQGLTLIDSVTTPRITDMDIHEFSAELNLTTANTTDPLWIRIVNLPGTGTDLGAWICIDNLELTSETLQFLYGSPLNGAIKVPVEVASTENDLVWSIVDPNIVEIDLYFGIENDPNLTLDPGGQGYQRIDGMAVTPGQYTYNLEDLGTDLDYFTNYYWKVVGYEPNSLGGLDAVPGPVWTFRTISDMPTVDPVAPVFQAVPAGQNAVLTVASDNVLSYQWYQVGDPNPLTDGTDFSGTTTDTLTVLDVQLADEASFYCVGTNGAGSDSSIDEVTGEGAGRLMVQRLTSYWPLDTDNAAVVDGNDVQLDTVDGYDMVLASAVTGSDTGLDYPMLESNVVSAIVGDESLRFNNSNEADPNNAWGQFALVNPGVAEFEDITIACWVYWAGGSTWQRIFDFGNGTGEYMFLSPNAAGTNLRFVVGGEGNEQNVQTETLAIGEWTYVTVTLNADIGRIYVNGELANTNENFTFNPYTVNMAVNYIADSQYGGDPYFNGLIDDLKIYNFARTTEQVAQDYLDVQGEYICNNEVEALVYDFNDDCQTTLEDFAMFAVEWLNSNRIYPN
jgi:hypothetical protein